MSLDEAIKHCEEKVLELNIMTNELKSSNKISDRALSERCEGCANEHTQLAEWLRELKDRRQND